VVTSIPADETIANAPDFREDPNSPLTVSNSQSGTVTLSDTYTLIRLLGTVTNTAGTQQQVGLRVNGVTASDYDFRTESGSTTFNASQAPLVQQDLEDGDEAGGAVDALGQFGGNARWAGRVMLAVEPFREPAFMIGASTDIASPIQSITVRGDTGAINAEFAVFGFDPNP